MTIKEEKKLSAELLKRIYGNLGFVPGHPNEDLGLTSISQDLTITEDGEEVKKPIYSGMLEQHNISISLCDFGEKKDKYLIGLLSLHDQSVGMMLEWGMDFYEGHFLLWVGDIWADLPMHSQIEVGHLIELVTVEGLPWTNHTLEISELSRLKELVEMS